MSWHLKSWFAKQQKRNEADNKMLTNDKNKCKSSPPPQKWMMREVQGKIKLIRPVQQSANVKRSKCEPGTTRLVEKNEEQLARQMVPKGKESALTLMQHRLQAMRRQPISWPQIYQRMRPEFLHEPEMTTDMDDDFSYNDYWTPNQIDCIRDLIWEEIQADKKQNGGEQQNSKSTPDLVTTARMGLSAYGLGRRFLEHKDLVKEKVNYFLNAVSRKQEQITSQLQVSSEEGSEEQAQQPPNVLPPNPDELEKPCEPRVATLEECLSDAPLQ